LGIKPFGRGRGGGKSSWASLDPTASAGEDRAGARMGNHAAG
jgi:hypothetical protein